MRIAQWTKHHPPVKDRKRHPWVRLYLDDPRLFVLSDAQRGQIVAILLAADADGNLPDDPQILKKVCRLDDIPDLQAPEMAAFFEDVPEAYTKCEQIEHNPSTKRGDNVVSLARVRAEHDKDIDKAIDKAIEPSPLDIIPIENSSPAIAGQKTLDSESESLSVEITDSPADQSALFLEAYNAVAEEIGLPRAVRMSAGRKTRLKQRLAEHGPQGMAKALDNLRQSPFCRGENDRGWRADIDFILQSQSCQRLIEGRYTHCSPKSNLQKAMELIDANNHTTDGFRDGGKAHPRLSPPGESPPRITGDPDETVGNSPDRPE